MTLLTKSHGAVIFPTLTRGRCHTETPFDATIRHHLVGHKTMAQVTFQALGYAKWKLMSIYLLREPICMIFII